MNELVIKNENHIEDMIYEIRGKQVMLDSDLAKICGIETKRINEAVKNNSKKFLDNCYFRISEVEYNSLKSKNSTSNIRGGSRKGHTVFTEHGIIVLSTILKSKITSKIIILIKDAFRKKHEIDYNMSLSIENQGKISSMIYEVRGKQVMLDTDLARLYQCKNGTKTINQSVKRHINRFPERFMFQLTEIEMNNLRSQVGTANVHDKTRTLPYAFTEQGVAMLATVLRTPVAEEISIQIMDAFVLMKKYISNDLLEQRYFKNMLLEDHEKIKILQESFSKLENKKIMNEIYFDGQIYDAYSKLIDIMNMANDELIIVDSYADKRVLDMISKIDKKVILITKEKGLLKRIDLEKYNQQYHNLKVIRNNTFHDRYLILDKKEVYHLGTSLNYAGSKTFGVNRLEDIIVINALINHIQTVIKIND